MRQIYIGIDPGVTGAIAAIDDEGSVLIHDWALGNPADVKSERDKIERDMNSAVRAHAFLRSFKALDCLVRCATIECVHAIGVIETDRQTGARRMKSQSGRSNMTFGRNFGLALGIVAAEFADTDVRVKLVLPQKWMSDMKVPAKISKSDKPSFNFAQELYPSAPLKFKSKHHNRADAILIAKWGHINYNVSTYDVSLPSAYDFSTI